MRHPENPISHLSWRFAQLFSLLSCQFSVAKHRHRH